MLINIENTFINQSLTNFILTNDYFVAWKNNIVLAYKDLWKKIHV